MEYNYPKFTPEMKKTHTILIPNMAITQFRLLEYALRYDGYKCEILGNCGSAVAHVVSNGVELKNFEQDKEKGEEFRRKYDFKKEDKVIVGIGLYIERKGIIDFVELAKRMPEYKFIWFGYSPLAAATGPVKKAVHTKLDNLTFAGYVEPSMIKSAMNGADLFLFPTLEETEGIPIIEACACKCDAIIRDIPIFDGWLKDGKNVYKAKDVDEFERKIRLFFDGKLKSLASNAYKIAEERDLKNIGNKLKNIYEEVMHSSK